MSEPTPRAPSSTFGRTVLLGVVSGALAAVACAKPWAHLTSAAARGIPADEPGLHSAGEVPLALSVTLVALAAWGALLVTRAGLRRAFAYVGALASAVGLVVTVVSWWTARQAVRHALSTALALPQATADRTRVSIDGWYWVALLAELVLLASFVIACREVAGWPTMGSRYDAPATAAARAREHPVTQQELWKALDQGQDPTVEVEQRGETR